MRGRKKIDGGDYYNINNTWRIDKDKLNFVLQRKGTNAEGKDGTSWTTVGYFQTVKQVYHALVEKSIKEVSLNDLKALNNCVDELHKLIEDAHIKGIMNQDKIS